MPDRKRIRELSMACRLAYMQHGTLFGKTLEDIANVLSTPTWFSANELRLVADAMDALNISTADGWTTRLRLDEFERAGSSFTAAAFADYLRNLPNGGMQA